MNVVAFLYASTIIVGAISPGHGTHYKFRKKFELKKSDYSDEKILKALNDNNFHEELIRLGFHHKFRRKKGCRI